MQWKHKDLLDVSQLSADEVRHILATAAYFREINSRPVKKVPTLKGRSVVLFFAEPSTRTKTSFDMAGKRLSADTFALAKSGSSLVKGETLKDTALTLQAMNPDGIVIRHGSSGAAQFLAERLECSVINAGDGRHAHPTQALLDALTFSRRWKGDFAGKTIRVRFHVDGDDSFEFGGLAIDDFSVTAILPPTVTTPTSTAVTATTATLGGNVTSDGGSAITERGVVYSVTTTNADPLIGGTGVTKLTTSGTTGVFTVGATGLSPADYSFKAFATNAER